jgi:hypothetical protein
MKYFLILLLKKYNIGMETVLTDEEISQFTIDEFWSEIEEGYREIERGEYLTQEELDEAIAKIITL